MSRPNLSFLGIATALLFVAFPCAAQKVTTTLDNGFDFDSCKRYAWGQNHIITRQGRANDALIGQNIVQEVNRTLAAKGFREDPSSPDFYISFDAGASDLAADIEGAHRSSPRFHDDDRSGLRSRPKRVVFGGRPHYLPHYGREIEQTCMDGRSDEENP